MLRVYVVGEPVFIVDPHTYSTYVAGTVKKITPSGLIDVEVVRASGTSEVMRFRERWGSYRYQGAGSYNAYFLDDMPYAERVEDIARDKRLKVARGKCANLIPGLSSYVSYSRGDLLFKLRELQTKLDEAMVLVEAV